MHAGLNEPLENKNPRRLIRTVLLRLEEGRRRLRRAQSLEGVRLHQRHVLRLPRMVATSFSRIDRLSGEKIIIS